MGRLANMAFDVRHWWHQFRFRWRRDPWLLDVDVEALQEGPGPDWTDPWASNEWQRTLVAPLFVGGPADGHRDEPRPRYELVERISMPVVSRGAVLWEDLDDSHVEQRFAVDVYVYRLGVYRDAFTVEYR